MDELLDMPSDVERAARVKVGHTCAPVSEHERWLQTAECYFILFFPVLQDLLVDCFKPTEVKHSSSSLPCS